MVGQMSLLYFAMASSVAGEIAFPPQRWVRCGSSIR